MKYFDTTEHGSRQKFRYSRPEETESFIQHGSRLSCYLNKWLMFAKVERMYKVVCDFMVRHQFLEPYNKNLYVHLKPNKR